MGYILGINLLPSTGEFTYDPIPYSASAPGFFRWVTADLSFGSTRH